MLISSIVRDFKSPSRLEEQTVGLTNPQVSKLVVTSSNPLNKKYYGRNWLRLEPFENIIDEDTAFVRNVYVEIAKATSDSFKVTIKKIARGNTRPEANSLANLIDFNVQQQDSILQLDKGIAINKTDKFRNQAVIITVYVPVGKQIRINKGIGWQVHFGDDRWARNWNDNFDEWDGEADMRWQSDVDYIMKEDGLYTLTGSKADGWNDKKRSRTNYNSNDNGDAYRYNDYDKKADSIRRINDQKRQQKLDSLDREDKKRERMRDSLENTGLLSPEPSGIISVIMPGGPAYSNI
jgi:hypothetical protein